LDLGDRSSSYYMLNEEGVVLREGSTATTKKGLNQAFGAMPPWRVALEVGTHSPWVSRLLSPMGHEVLLANARCVQLITRTSRRDDRLDAEALARLARIDPQLLAPIRHRSAEAQAHLTMARRARL
jgi:transposase